MPNTESKQCFILFSPQETSNARLPQQPKTLVPWVGTREVRDLDVWSDSFISWGEAGSYGFPSDYIYGSVLGMGFTAIECLLFAYLSNVAGFALSQGRGTLQPIFGFPTVEADPCVDVESVHSWEDRESRGSFSAMSLQIFYVVFFLLMLF